ncbi:MAG: hypothetical protein D6806_15745 [Deltaproteobacteria bacterium]|nr:MAG: hypothetical protein D6806_15745 [Deltaproteobacteria bacterium]
MGFRYRLDGLLKLRRIEETKAMEDLAQQRRLDAEAERRLRLLEQELECCKKSMAENASCGTDGNEMLMLFRRSQVLEDRIRRVKAERREIEKRIRSCMERLEKKTAMRKGQEKHRQNEYERWRRQDRHRQQKCDDGLTSARQARKAEVCNE